MSSDAPRRPGLLELHVVGAQLRAAAMDGVAAVDEVLARAADARSAGRGPAPSDAVVVGDQVWYVEPRCTPDRLGALTPLAALAYDLAESEARSRALLNASFEGLCLHEAGHILEVNEVLASLYGYRRDEMIGMHMSALAAPEILPRIQRIVATGYSGAYETLALTADGSRMPLEARGKAAMWNGRPVRIAAFRDLRERKKVEAELVAAREAAEEASAAKSRFLTNMSHELRTPMNGVLGMVELLLGDTLSEVQRERAAVLQASGTHLMELLNDILDLSQIEEGRLELRPEQVNLKTLVFEVFDTVRRAATERGLSLRLDVPVHLPLCWMLDPLRLRQVLVNLLGNAVRHTWSGSVTVRLSSTDGHLQVAVIDTGEGMTADLRQQLFERFSGRGARSGRGRSGLGLSISAELVRVMGGVLAVESEPGAGATFSFSVPSEAVPADAAGARVFVLDDESRRRESLIRALESRGVVVMGHTGSHGAAAVVAAFVPDLVYVATGTAPSGMPVVAVGPHADGAPTGQEVVHVADPVTCDDLLLVRQQAGAAVGAPERVPYRALSVLIVDDHPVNRMVAEQLVVRAGHRVRSAASGMGAVRMCTSETFDLVLMDVEMPEMCGVEATRVLRQAGYDGRIVALTAHVLDGEARTCIEAGMNEVLTKPVSAAQLLGVLRDAAR